MFRNTQVLSWLTEILRDRKFLLDVTGCRKTQVSDCTSSTVFIQDCTTGLYNIEKGFNNIQTFQSDQNLGICVTFCSGAHFYVFFVCF